MTATASPLPAADPDPHSIEDLGNWTLVLNSDQSLLGRCYLILKRPETDVLALNSEELSELWTLASRVKASLTLLWQPDHFNYAFLMNETPQVHLHVIPRYRGRREWAGATFVDPHFGQHYGVGPARTVDSSVVTATSAAIRRHL